MKKGGGFFRQMGGLFRACRSIKKLSDGSGDDRQEGLCSGGRSGDDRQEGRRSGGRTIVLAGDPNVGKSVFFTALSGVYREVSNYAGTTVDVRCARLGQDTLVDIPGVYGVGSANEEERVARDVVLSADIVINIVDAVHLSRDLFLTIQLIEMGIPLVVVLNMMDEADRRGIIIDRETLSHRLGVPVVGASGALGKGIDEVKRSIGSARTGHVDDGMRSLLDRVMAGGASQREALLLLEEGMLLGEQRAGHRRSRSSGDAPSCEQDVKRKSAPSCEQDTKRKSAPSCGRCGSCGSRMFGYSDRPSPSLREEIAAHRRSRVNVICEEVILSHAHRTARLADIGHLTVAPISGMAILCLVLAMLYLFVGVFVAQDVVGVTEGFCRTVYEPFVCALIAEHLFEGSFLFALFVGDYGLFTMTVTYLFGLILPLVAGSCLALAVLEDSGYLPRLAALVDRLMNMIGLNGRAVIPLILGFGCVTMATTATRVMGSERERTIVCALLGLIVPCSAQFGIIAALMARLSAGYIAVYLGTMIIVFFLAGKLLSLFVGGRTSDLFIDLPPLRIPQAKNVMRKVAVKTVHFVREGVGVFAGGGIFLTMLEESGGLLLFAEMLAPVTEDILWLPRETASIFLMGMVRRDLAAAGLTDIFLTDGQLTVALVVITLFVPCIATVLMMVKERGKKEGIAVWLTSLVTAFIVGGVLARYIR